MSHANPSSIQCTSVRHYKNKYSFIKLHIYFYSFSFFIIFHTDQHFTPFIHQLLTSDSFTLSSSVLALRCLKLPTSSNTSLLSSISIHPIFFSHCIALFYIHWLLYLLRSQTVIKLTKGCNFIFYHLQRIVEITSIFH